MDTLKLIFWYTLLVILSPFLIISEVNENIKLKRAYKELETAYADLEYDLDEIEE